MADIARRGLTVDEFFDWCKGRDEHFELVDGVPVPLRAMAAASMVHDRIAGNVFAALHTQLRGSGCRPTTPDVAVRTAIKRVRRPDVTIECSPLQRDTYEALKPIAVFEVLSPTTRKNDRNVKLAEYMRHPSLLAIVHIDPDLMDVLVYRKLDDGTWDTDRFTAGADSVYIADLPVALTLTSIYEDVPLTL